MLHRTPPSCGSACDDVTEREERPDLGKDEDSLPEGPENGASPDVEPARAPRGLLVGLVLGALLWLALAALYLLR